MAALWRGGAELQSTAATVEFSSIVTNAPAIETTTKRSGAASWRISNTVGVEGWRQGHASTQGQFFFQFYLYIVAMTASTRHIAGARTTGTRLISIRLTSAGLLQLYNAEDSAQVGSDSSALSTGTWYRIALMYDSTTLNATSIEARAYTDVAGAAAFWNPSGTIDLAANPTNFGCYTDFQDTTLDYLTDDCAINDTSGSFQTSWPGEMKYIVLRPNAAGDNNAWGRGGVDSGANWSQASEIPPDGGTSYVESNTSGQIDDYNLDATPGEMGASDTINAVLVGVQAAVSDATGADPDIVLRIKASASGTVEESASLDVNSLTYHGPAPLPANDNYQLVLYDLPGASTTAWTKSDLDQAQAGVREAVTDTHFARVAALWVGVDFTPVTGGSTYTKTGEADSPHVASGADQVTATEQGAGFAPATASGADQTVWTETATGISTFGASGASEYIPATGAQVYTKTGGVTTTAQASGADQFTTTETGAAESPHAAGGTHDASGGGMGSWVAHAGLYDAGELARVKINKGEPHPELNTPRIEREMADEELLMLVSVL